ncbi:MAG: PKD domain-containing protein [Chitinophagales bacterium]|nr:PKD domain-containing protein [Chitinophagales bacterium]
MKKTMFFLLIAFLMPQLSFSQGSCHFSAQVYSQDPCCIIINAGCGDETAWTVVVDGTTTYDYTDYDQVLGGPQILHCYGGNGVHSVNFYVNGELYWSQNVEITGCDGYCDVCDIKPMVASYYDFPDDCQTFLDVDFQNLNGGTAFSSECTNPTFVWDFGDGTSSSPSSSTYALHSYPADGTYTACVTFSVTNPDGELCVVSQCIEVVVEGCDEEEPCCGFAIDGPGYIIAPWDPCLVRLSPGSRSYSGECSNHTISYDIDGDGTIEHVGTYFMHTFSGPGPHTVCVTMSYGDCEVSDCTTFTLPDCTGLKGGGEALGSGNWEQALEDKIEFFPNPVTDQLNIKLIDNPWNPTQLVMLMDVSGKVVQAQRPVDPNQIQLDMSGLASGIYTVQILGTEGVITTERIVKTQ